MNLGDEFTPISQSEKIDLNLKLLERDPSVCQNKWFLDGKFLLPLIFLLSFIVIAGLIQYLGQNYSQINLNEKNLSPSLTHLFGTDELGRDLLSRAAKGLHISISVGIIAAIIDLMIGLIMGFAVGYGSKILSSTLLILMDVLQSIPYLLIAILMVVALGSGIAAVVFALTITGWINMARVVAAESKQLKSKDYVISAKLFGASWIRIAFLYIFPNCIGTIVATLAVTVPSAMFTEAFLSFLGLGIKAPSASLGSLASDGLPFLRMQPWRVFFPSILLSSVIFCFNLISYKVSELFEVDNVL